MRTLAAQAFNHLRPLSRRALRTISGIGIAYPAGRGAHPLTGRRAPDIRLADGSRLYALLRQGTVRPDHPCRRATASPVP